MGLFDNLTGMLGGGPGEGQQGGGAMGMFGQLLGQGGGPSSNILGSLLGGGQQAQGDASQGGQAPAAGGIAGMLETLAAGGQAGG